MPNFILSYISSFHAHMRYFFTSLKEQFLYYKRLKKASYHASSDIFKHVAVILILQTPYHSKKSFPASALSVVFMAEGETF